MKRFMMATCLLTLISSSAFADSFGIARYLRTADAQCKKIVLGYTCDWKLLALDEAQAFIEGGGVRVTAGASTRSWAPAVANTIRLSCGEKTLGRHAEVLSKSAFKSFVLKPEDLAGCDGDVQISIHWHGGLIKADSLEDTLIILNQDF